MSESTKHYKVKPSEEKPEQFYYIQYNKENGKTLNTSETYTRREDAVRAIFDANPEPRDVDIVHEYHDR